MKRREVDKRSLNALIEDVLIKHTGHYFEKTNTRRDEFVKQRLLPELIRAGVESDRPDAQSQSCFQVALSKKVERWLKKEVKSVDPNYLLPWINALPDDYRTLILQELCGLFGSFYNPLPAVSFSPASVQQMKSRLADISEKFGCMLSNSEPAMDGVFDERDDPEKLQNYANEIFSMITVAIVELEAVAKGTGVIPSAYQAMNNILFTAREGQQ